MNCSLPLPARFVGAHDALTARLGERAGFQGIWASGLEITASHGVPDDGMLSWDKLLGRIQEMCVAVTVPVWVDADNCAPTAAEVSERLRNLESSGAAGLVMEDKRVPKVNSFDTGTHELEPIGLVCDKLRAAVESRRESSFHVIARTEALIAGSSVLDTYERCLRYLESGATGLIVHSREPHPYKMLEILAKLPGECHSVAIPTSYYELTAKELGRAGVRTVVYANHGLRAQIAAIREVYESILTLGSSVEAEGRIASMNDVFELQQAPLPLSVSESP